MYCSNEMVTSLFDSQFSGTVGQNKERERGANVKRRKRYIL